MKQEEYAEFCYLLGKLKYILAKELLSCKLTGLAKQDTERQIKMIEEIQRICIVERDIEFNYNECEGENK